MKRYIVGIILLISTNIFAALNEGDLPQDSITGATDMPGQEQIVCDELRETGEKSVADNKKLADQFNRNCTSQAEKAANDNDCEDLRDNIEARKLETNKIRNEYDGRGCRELHSGS